MRVPTYLRRAAVIAAATAVALLALVAGSQAMTQADSAGGSGYHDSDFEWG